MQIATVSPVAGESISPKVYIGVNKLQIIQSIVPNLVAVDSMMLQLSSNVVFRLFAGRRSNTVDVVVPLKSVGPTGSNQRLQPSLDATDDFCCSDIWPCTDEKQAAGCG